ncbi:MAG: GerMN domain-containing protein [Actinobacteria bacterium]|nr:GerMN domain-containing protein [Actinomycetota bacterium]
MRTAPLGGTGARPGGGASAGARLVVGLVLVVVVVLATACGLPRDSQPRPIDLGGGVTRPSSTPSTARAGNAARVVTLYFVERNRLRRVERPVASEVTLDQSLVALLAGPTRDEQQRNLSSAIPLDTRLQGLRLNGVVLTVRLSRQINQIEGVGQKLAFAEIVFTATAFVNVDRVQFEVAGKLVAVPTDDGNIGTVERSSYSSIGP